MSKLPTPCVRCGQPTKGACDCIKPKTVNDHIKQKPTRKQRGYDYAWEKLSLRARKLQPFCTDCNTTHDLQADHSVEAWERKAKGLPIRLQDIDVVCGTCNRARGAARGLNARRDAEGPNDTYIPKHAKSRSDSHTATQGTIPKQEQPEPDDPNSSLNYFPYDWIDE